MTSIQESYQGYQRLLGRALEAVDAVQIEVLAGELTAARDAGRRIFFCGNGGSAANALHWANDLIYGAGVHGRGGLDAIALTANVSVLTCLANDLSYAEVFASQLSVQGRPGDILIALSGSGNSPNILRALEVARGKGLTSWAILGFDGGKARAAADHVIHFPVHDMQVAEDCQMVLAHVITRQLAGPPRT